MEVFHSLPQAPRNPEEELEPKLRQHFESKGVRELRGYKIILPSGKTATRGGSLKTIFDYYAGGGGGIMLTPIEVRAIGSILEIKEIIGNSIYLRSSVYEVADELGMSKVNLDKTLEKIRDVINGQPRYLDSDQNTIKTGSYLYRLIEIQKKTPEKINNFLLASLSKSWWIVFQLSLQLNPADGRYPSSQDIENILRFWKIDVSTSINLCLGNVIKNIENPNAELYIRRLYNDLITLKQNEAQLEHILTEPRMVIVNYIIDAIERGLPIGSGIGRLAIEEIRNGINKKRGPDFITRTAISRFVNEIVPREAGKFVRLQEP